MADTFELLTLHDLNNVDDIWRWFYEVFLPRVYISHHDNGMERVGKDRGKLILKSSAILLSASLLISKSFVDRQRFYCYSKYEWICRRYHEFQPPYHGYSLYAAACCQWNRDILHQTP